MSKGPAIIKGNVGDHNTHLEHVRVMHDELTKAGLHPLAVKHITAIAERLRVQHQQDLAIAEAYGKLLDKFIEFQQRVLNFHGHVDKKLNLTEEIKRMQEQEGEEHINLHDMLRKNH